MGKIYLWRDSSVTSAWRSQTAQTPTCTTSHLSFLFHLPCKQQKCHIKHHKSRTLSKCWSDVTFRIYSLSQQSVFTNFALFLFGYLQRGRLTIIYMKTLSFLFVSHNDNFPLTLSTYRPRLLCERESPTSIRLFDIFVG